MSGSEKESSIRESRISDAPHTDARGTEAYNRDLSERRARAVADYLVEAGLSADLFTIQGLGKSQLRDPGNSADAHSRNRRVELGLINSRMLR